MIISSLKVVCDSGNYMIQAICFPVSPGILDGTLDSKSHAGIFVLLMTTLWMDQGPRPTSK